MLFSDPLYLTTAVNTLLFVAIGVNVTMFLAFLLSGFFMSRSWWIRLAAGHLPATLGVAGADRVPVDPLHAGHRNGACSTACGAR